MIIKLFNHQKQKQSIVSHIRYFLILESTPIYLSYQDFQQELRQKRISCFTPSYKTPSLSVRLTGLTGFLDTCIILKKLHIIATSKGLLCTAAAGTPELGRSNESWTNREDSACIPKTLRRKDVTGFRDGGIKCAHLCETRAEGNQRLPSPRTAIQPKCPRTLLPSHPAPWSTHPSSRGIPELLLEGQDRAHKTGQRTVPVVRAYHQERQPDAVRRDTPGVVLKQLGVEREDQGRLGTSLAIQWLRLHASNCRGHGFNPCSGN